MGLTANGQADVVISLNGGAAPVRLGTVARIEDAWARLVAGQYVVLYPGPSGAPTIPSVGRRPAHDAYAEVSLDALFDALNPLTRAGISNLIKGSAASIQGRALAANRTLHYLAPGLYSTSRVTQELASNQPAFDGLLVQGARAMQALAARSQDLTSLIANADVATGAIAQQSRALQTALALLPQTLTRSTDTFTGLRARLTRSIPSSPPRFRATRPLTPFAQQLGTLATDALPTVQDLSELIHNPSGTGDLTELFQETPALAAISSIAFPNLIAAMNAGRTRRTTCANTRPTSSPRWRTSGRHRPTMTPTGITRARSHTSAPSD